MSTLSLAAGNFTRGQRGEDSGLGFWLSSYFGNELFATDTRGNLMRTSNRVHFKYLEGSRTRNGKKFHVFAKVRNWKKHDYPWPDDVDPNTESPLKYLSNFKPLDEKPKPVTLAFEKPLVDLEQKIIEVTHL